MSEKILVEKILVIDDERPTLSMFQLHLSAYGFEVFVAENGEEGIASFRKEHPPIVLTDIKMPGMDGIEVLKSIKEIAPQTEVIIITGHGDMDLAIKALNLDATDFINKPIRQEDLDAALKRARERLGLSRKQTEDYSVRKTDTVGIIDIKGSINSTSDAQLTESFSKALEGRDKLVLAFSENSSINGAGIALLSQLLMDCRDSKTPVAISGLSDNFKKVVDIVGINKLAAVYDTEEGAIKALG